ncbi:H+/Cl- antiporter ClcA [Clostridium pascui]|nr:voltage-gated chloride channel family protein [Clostridium pascui]MBM7869957.1 H+/Cl- antiporter ClcA [Clostridium pascui]
MKEIRKDTKNKVIILNSQNNSVVLSLTFIKWIIIGAIVGIITGFAAALFLKSLELATALRMKYTWLLFFLPLGGALVSFLYSRYGKNSSKGNNLIIEKINESSGRVPFRMAPLVFFGTFITHLFGGSAGREGTGVQIGASIAEGIGDLLKLDKVDNRIILMAGISSGFATVFGTPLAGTIFGLEVVELGIMSYEALIPAFTGSIIGDFMVSFLGVHHTHYKVVGVPDLTLLTIIKIAFAAILFGLTSKLFSELTHKLKELFTEGFENSTIKSLVGGMLVIVLVYMFGTREFLGLSIPLISESFSGQVHPFTFLGKIVFTSLTLGTGFQGGEVTPLFVIGSTLGNTLSNALNMSPSFLASLGLIGVFAGATNTPIASFILSIEMFGSQGIVFVFMTCAISYIFSGHTGIYTSQKIRRSKSKLIEVPHNATLSYFRQNNKNKTKETKQVLVGQFRFGRSSVEIPTLEGLNLIRVKVSGKGVRLVHHSYNPDGSIWSAKSINGQLEYINLDNYSKEIHAISVSQSYGKKDKLLLINANLWASVEIDYIGEQPKNTEVKTSNNDYDDAHEEGQSHIINMDSILVGQLNIGESRVELPAEKGINRYVINVKGGDIRLNHSSYNPDGHTWSTPPGNNERQHIDLYEGTHTLDIFVSEYYGKKNRIELVNGSFFDSVEVSFLAQKVNLTEETVEDID